MARGHTERPDVVVSDALSTVRGDEVRQAGLALRALLAQEVQGVALGCKAHIVAIPVGFKQAEYRLTAHSVLCRHPVQHGLRIGLEFLGLPPQSGRRPADRGSGRAVPNF